MEKPHFAIRYAIKCRVFCLAQQLGEPLQEDDLLAGLNLGEVRGDAEADRDHGVSAEK